MMAYHIDPVTTPISQISSKDCVCPQKMDNEYSMDNKPDNQPENAGTPRQPAGVIDPPAEALLALAVAQLNAHSGVKAKIMDTGTLQLEYGPHRTEFKVTARLHPAPAVDEVLTRPYITNHLGQNLKKQNVNYLDAAGNAHLQGPNFLLWITGQPRNPEQLQAIAAREPLGRPFEPKGLQVLFTLLCRPECVAHPYREIAALASVAHGTVGHVIQDLEAMGFIVPVPTAAGGGRGGRRLVKTAALLEQWARVFVRTLRPKQLIGRYRGRPPDELTTVRWADHGALLGGEFAADAVTTYLRPGTLTLYLQDDRPAAALLRELRLQPDPRGNIELLKKFWTFDTPDTKKPDLAPLPLVYADLIASGDARCEETAKLLLANFDGEIAA